MKYLVLAVVFAAGYLAAYLTGAITAADPQQPAAPQPPPNGGYQQANPNIDFAGYMKLAEAAQKHREKRRLSEDDFIRMSKEKGVIVLDARSKEKYDLLHVEGAINLNFADIDIESLKKTLPDKDATILIYCNNNFVVNGPSTDAATKLAGPEVKAVQNKAAAAFPTKAKVASLNISTYITTYGYGYKNVYELGPVLDPTTTKLKLVSSEKK